LNIDGRIEILVYKDCGKRNMGTLGFEFLSNKPCLPLPRSEADHRKMLSSPKLNFPLLEAPVFGGVACTSARLYYSPITLEKREWFY
jgi:hypothetical protein